jgi:hypothetical protein
MKRGIAAFNSEITEHDDRIKRARCELTDHDNAFFALPPEMWDRVRIALDIVMRARLRLVCRELRDLERAELTPAWAREHHDLASLGPVHRGFWRHLLKELALLGWPMPAPRQIVAQDRDSTLVPHELWVWWTRDAKTIRYYDGLIVYTGMTSAEVPEFYDSYGATSSLDLDDPYRGPCYSRLAMAIYDSILHGECPACHGIGATWNMINEYGYCCLCHSAISSRTRDSCPVCTSRNIHPAGTSGVMSCHTCLHQFLNH